MAEGRSGFDPSARAGPRPVRRHLSGGESMAAMQARSVAAIRCPDTAFEAEYGLGAVCVAVSHGEIIKSILADSFGTLTCSSALTVGPCSVSIVPAA